jgi:hypothetical protein
MKSSGPGKDRAVPVVFLSKVADRPRLERRADMSVRNFLHATVCISMLAFAASANAQVLGGGLGGSLNGALGGLGGLGSLGAPTSVATGTLRDVNGMARSSTRHAHDQLDAAATTGDRAAQRLDGQLKSVDAAANSATSAASSAVAENQPVKDVASKTPERAAGMKQRTADTKPLQVPSANVSAATSANAAADASAAH